MSFYTGQPYCAGTVCIGAPVVEQILVTPIAPDVVGDVRHYLASSPTAHDELYFCIYEEGAPVGQIVLHDINWATGESLIGYCLFRPELRGRGVGTLALRLLQQFVVGAGRPSHRPQVWLCPSRRRMGRSREAGGL
jgi:hypothetical protein